MDWIEITAEQVTPAIRRLFRTDEPQARRCFAALDGAPPAGKILVDDTVDPTWGAVLEAYENTLFLGGSFDATPLADLFAALRRERDVIIGMWPDDPRIGSLPPGPAYDGRTLEFYARPVGEGLDRHLHPVPADCTVKRLDRELIMRTEWGPEDVRMMGGLEAWQEWCFGYCLVRGDEIVSEATVGAPALGLYEPGVFTQPEHRGKGYATIVAAQLIREIEARGGKTYWNCAKENVASVAIARKLGYRIEREYRCMLWSRTT